MVGLLSRAFVAIGTQSAHEVREAARERGRNEVGERGPQPACKRQRELHSIERCQGRTTHRDRFSDKNLPARFASYAMENANCGGLFSPRRIILPAREAALPWNQERSCVAGVVNAARARPSPQTPQGDPRRKTRTNK
jgi:hypothetical protein